MAARTVYVPGWTPVGWEEVERLRGEWEAWTTPVLELDAINPTEENVEKAAGYLGM